MVIDRLLHQSWPQRLGLAVVAGLCALAATSASALQIDFDSLTSGSYSAFPFAASATPSLVVNIGGMDVTFQGGSLLNQVSSLPADTTSVYGTSSYSGGLENPLRIIFSVPVQNVSLNIYNGQTAGTLYQVADSTGGHQNFSLAPNIFGGSALYNYSGIVSEIDISDASGRASWDYFIDNLNFDLTPPTVPQVPDEAPTAILLGVTLLAWMPLRCKIIGSMTPTSG